MALLAGMLNFKRVSQLTLHLTCHSMQSHNGRVSALCPWELPSLMAGFMLTLIPLHRLPQALM